MAVAFIQYFLSGQLFRDAAISLSRVVVGYLSAAVLGIGFGVLTGRSARAEATIGFVFQLIRPIPPISFVPFAVLWFGLGEVSKDFLVFIGVFFPVWLNSHQGISHVERHYIWAAQSMGASKARLVSEIYLFGAAPLIVSGLRVGTGIAFYCLVAAEIAGAFSGLAFRIEVAHLAFRVDRMIAGLVVLGVLSAAIDWAMQRLIVRVLPWTATAEDNAD